MVLGLAGLAAKNKGSCWISTACAVLEACSQLFCGGVFGFEGCIKVLQTPKP